jgi:hypothetical protein
MNEVDRNAIFDEGLAVGIARSLARTHYRHRDDPDGRVLAEVEDRLRERGLGALVPVALGAYAAEWTRLTRPGDEPRRLGRVTPGAW